MAYRTGKDLDNKPTPKKCTSRTKILKRIRQLERDKARIPNSRGIIRRWTDRKESILSNLKARLNEGFGLTR